VYRAPDDISEKKDSEPLLILENNTELNETFLEGEEEHEEEEDSSHLEVKLGNRRWWASENDAPPPKRKRLKKEAILKCDACSATFSKEIDLSRHQG
jgi:hypothetical protein